MEDIKKEKIFVRIISNVLILAMLAVFVFIGFYKSDENELHVTNSEYNGTIYAGDKNSKNVTLMVNVYWGTEYLEEMLKIFEKHNIKTTFFIGGTWAKDNPELLKSMYQSGHEIASHGYSHKEHGKLSLETNLAEISKCHEMINHILGINMELFAPPGGSYNQNTIKAATSLGYKTIMWTRDTIDWRDKDVNLIHNRAITNLSGGDLILMHPTECTSKALEQILNDIKEKGYNVTTVSETLDLKNSL